MGVLDFLFGGWTRLIEYEIRFDGFHVSVVLHDVFPGIPRLEYARLWAHYLARVMWNFRVDSLWASLILDSLEPALACEAIPEDVLEFFRREPTSTVFSYYPDVPEAVTKCWGNFSAKGTRRRNLQTYFANRDLSEVDVLVSVPALLQRCIGKLDDDYAARTALHLVGQNMLQAYRQGRGRGIMDIVSLPEQAFLAAITELKRDGVPF